VAYSALLKESCRNLFGSNVDPTQLLGDLAGGNAGLRSITLGDLGPPSNGSVTAANTTGILGTITVTGKYTFYSISGKRVGPQDKCRTPNTSQPSVHVRP